MIIWRFSEVFGVYLKKSEVLRVDKRISEVLVKLAKELADSLLVKCVRKQFVQRTIIVVVIFMDMIKYVCHPFLKVGTTHTAAFHQGIDDCGIFCGIVIATEQIVFTAQSNFSLAIFSDFIPKFG